MKTNILCLHTYGRINSIAEVIVSAIEVCEGAAADKVAASWGGATSKTVARALGALVPAKVTAGGGLVRFGFGRR